MTVLSSHLRRHHRSSRQRPPRRGLLLLAGLLAVPLGAPRQARAESGMGAIVRAFCLTAFQSEMSQAGKQPPEGMASFACSCVADRLLGGSNLDAARRDCRELTARRYPI